MNDYYWDMEYEVIHAIASLSLTVFALEELNAFLDGRIKDVEINDLSAWDIRYGAVDQIRKVINSLNSVTRNVKTALEQNEPGKKLPGTQASQV